MNIGDLREVITIQTPTLVSDPIGGQTEGAPAILVRDLPAAVDPIGLGRERIQIAQLRTSVDKLVRIRWRDDITVAMQVLWRDKTLEIGAVQELKHDELHLLCAEVQ